MATMAAATVLSPAMVRPAEGASKAAPKKGRGKGKKPEFVFAGDVPPSAQLPAKPTGEGAGKGDEPGKGGVWSAQYERQVVSQLDASEKQLSRMIDEEREAAERRKARMQELGKKIDAKG